MTNNASMLAALNVFPALMNSSHYSVPQIAESMGVSLNEARVTVAAMQLAGFIAIYTVRDDETYYHITSKGIHRRATLAKQLQGN